MTCRTAALLFGWAAVVGLLVPVLHTAWVSFSPDSFLTPPTGEWSTRWYRAFLADRRWMAAVTRSILVAGLAPVVGVAIATPAAYVASRCRESRWLTMFMLLPACVPPVALGMGVLPLFYATGLWGSLIGLVLMHATLGLPAAYLIIRTHLNGPLAELESAASGLGANRWQVLRRVTLPLLRPALIAAGVVVFVLSLNESLVTIFLATPSTETVPAVTWPQLRYSPTPLAAVASCVTALTGIAGVLLTLRTLPGRRPLRATTSHKSPV